MKKNPLFALITLVLAGVFLYIVFPHDSRGTATNTNSNVQVDQTIRVATSVVPKAQDITFPFAGVTATIPVSLFTVTADELTHFSSAENRTNRACGIFEHTTANGNLVWISYRDDSSHDPFCSYESNFPMPEKINTILGANADLCNGLATMPDIASCNIQSSTSSKVSAAIFFQQIPDALLDDQGTVIRTAYIPKDSSGQKSAVVFALIPQHINILNQDYTKFVRSLNASTNSEVVKFRADFNDFNAMVASVAR